MTKLIFIRHGQSLGNLENIFLGHTDWDLSEQGYRQAKITADYLQNEKIDAVYSSDLIRAYNTVLPIAEQRGLAVIRDKQLREIFAGEWEGQRYDDLMDKYPDEYAVWRNDIGSARCSGGESVRELQKRIVDEVKKIARVNPNRTVCIGTHATPIRVLNAYVNNIDFNHMKDIPWASNASVTVVEYDCGRMTMTEYCNDSFMGNNSTVFSSNI